MFNKLKHMKEMRSKAKKIQGVLAEEKIDVSAGGGKVKIVMNGNIEVESITLDPELLNADAKGKAQDLLKEAFNDAVKKTQRKMAVKMQQMGELNIPGVTGPAE